MASVDTTNGNGSGTEIQTRRASALVTLADRMGVKADSLFLESLRRVAFKAGDATDAQLLALCVVANQYGLNPFTRELYAFPDRGGIVPIVSVDGWTRIANEHPQFMGYDIRWADETIAHAGKQVPAWCEVTVHRRDRAEHPTIHREWFDECVRGTDPWKSHPRRMLSHKTLIQGFRRAFGFSGIYDPDEGERIVGADRPTIVPASPIQGTASARLAAAFRAAEPVDVESSSPSHDGEETSRATLAGLPGDVVVCGGEDPIPDSQGSGESPRGLILPVHADVPPTLYQALDAHVAELMSLGGADEPGEEKRIRAAAVEAIHARAVAEGKLPKTSGIRRQADGSIATDTESAIEALRRLDRSDPGWNLRALADHFGTTEGGTR